MEKPNEKNSSPPRAAARPRPVGDKKTQTENGESAHEPGSAASKKARPGHSKAMPARA